MRHPRQLFLRLHLQERQVGFRVGADEAGRQFALVVESDGDLLCARHDMVVGDDMAVSRDDEAGPDTRCRLPVAPFLGQGRAVAEEAAHELLRAGRHGRLGALLHADVHHGGRHPLDGPGEARQRGGRGIGRPGVLEAPTWVGAAGRKRAASRIAASAAGPAGEEQSGLHEVFPSLTVRPSRVRQKIGGRPYRDLAATLRSGKETGQQAPGSRGRRGAARFHFMLQLFRKFAQTLIAPDGR